MCPEAVSLFEASSFQAGGLSLKPDVLHLLDSLRQALLNGVALLVLAAGMIAGSICENSIVVTYLAAWGIVHKGWNHFKKFPIQVDRWQFAYTTGCWTSMASTTIPPRANPRPPWPNGLIARSRNSPTST